MQKNCCCHNTQYLAQSIYFDNVKQIFAHKQAKIPNFIVQLHFFSYGTLFFMVYFIGTAYVCALYQFSIPYLIECIRYPWFRLFTHIKILLIPKVKSIWHLIMRAMELCLRAWQHLLIVCSVYNYVPCPFVL